jgi:hypothetical protein
MNARRFIRICHLLERGEAITHACEPEAVTHRAFRVHVAKNPKYQTNLKEVEEIREPFFKAFHMANTSQHSIKSVLAFMWRLERRFPNAFALRSAIREDVNSATQEVFGKISLEQLIENARLAKEVADTPPARTDNGSWKRRKESNLITAGIEPGVRFTREILITSCLT